MKIHGVCLIPLQVICAVSGIDLSFSSAALEEMTKEQLVGRVRELELQLAGAMGKATAKQEKRSSMMRAHRGKQEMFDITASGGIAHHQETQTLSDASIVEALVPIHELSGEELQDFRQILAEEPHRATKLLGLVRSFVQKHLDGEDESSDEDKESHFGNAHGENDLSGDDSPLTGLDAGDAEKVEEMRAALKIEALASMELQQGVGNPSEEKQLEKDIAEGTRGPQVLQEVLDVASSVHEPVDDMVQAGLIPTQEDLTYLERLELSNPNITDPELVNDMHHPGGLEASDPESLGDGARALLSGRLGRIWPSHAGKTTIKYCKGSGLTGQAWDRFKSAAGRLSSHCSSLEFVEVSSGCELTVKGNEAGCWAYIGYSTGGRNEVNLQDGNWFSDAFTGTCATTGIAEHEILHALGMSHEQSRPDRNGHVDVKLGNVEGARAHNFDIDSGENTQVGYEIKSIMHYGCKSFSTSVFSDTLRAHRRRRFWDGYAGRKDCSEMGQRGGLSSGDIKQLQLMYSCSPEPVSSSRRRRKWFR
eukprot:TRINITY_DN30046_c0_g2_i1.p1 TRINITY_DN30046_c0_g2~~TRINITY_DN30046_c0_g2_i1.p1  ORF type:complete len:534 (+),score=105.77 TRINITY_DN30046_c0_g2_i1:87-1688(+)